MSEPLGKVEVIWQLRHRLKRVLRRRLRYVRNRFSRNGRAARPTTGATGTAPSEALVAGQAVRVKSREEIQTTLDPWNYLRGCGFMDEMWQYCDTNQRVLKPIKRFLDETDYRFKRPRGTVFLEGLTCKGTYDYGRCDRNCFYFWREEWLEKVE